MKMALQVTTTSLLGLALIALALFWPAGTFDYWQAWVFIAVFTATTILPSIRLAVRNPAVLQRRHRGFLGRVGVAVLERRDGTLTVGEIVVEVSDIFDAPREQIAADVHAFLADIAGRGMIEW